MFGRFFERFRALNSAENTDRMFSSALDFEERASVFLGQLFNVGRVQFDRQKHGSKNPIISMMVKVVQNRQGMKELKVAMGRTKSITTFTNMEIDWVQYVPNDDAHRAQIEAIQQNIQGAEYMVNTNAALAPVGAVTDFGLPLLTLIQLLADHQADLAANVNLLPDTFSLSRNVSWNSLDADAAIPQHSRIIAEICCEPSPAKILEKLWQLEKDLLFYVISDFWIRQRFQQDFTEWYDDFLNRNLYIVLAFAGNSDARAAAGQFVNQFGQQMPLVKKMADHGRLLYIHVLTQLEGTLRLEADVAEIRDTLKDRISRLEADVAEIRDTLKDRISRLEADVAEIRGDQQDRISRLEADVAEIRNAQQDRISRLDDIRNILLERLPAPQQPRQME